MDFQSEQFSLFFFFFFFFFFFYLYATPILPTKRNDFSFLFYLQVPLMLPIKSLESTGLSVQKKKRKKDFQDGVSLDFLSE